MADDNVPLLGVDQTAQQLPTRPKFRRIMSITVVTLLVLGGSAIAWLALSGNHILGGNLNPATKAGDTSEDTFTLDLKFNQDEAGLNTLAWPLIAPPIIVSQPYGANTFTLLFEQEVPSQPMRILDVITFDSAGVRINERQLETDITGRVEAAAETTTGSIGLILRDDRQITIAGFSNNDNQLWRHDLSDVDHRGANPTLASWGEAMFALLPGNQPDTLQLARYAADGFPDWRRNANKPDTSPIIVRPSPLDEIVLLRADAADANIVVEAINTSGQTVISTSIPLAGQAVPSSLAITEAGAIHALVLGRDSSLTTLSYNGDITHHETLSAGTYDLPSTACGLISEFGTTSLLSCVDSAGATLLRVGEGALATTPSTLSAKAASGQPKMLAAGPFGYLVWADGTSQLTHTPIEVVRNVLSDRPVSIISSPLEPSIAADPNTESEASSGPETAALSISPDEDELESDEAAADSTNPNARPEAAETKTDEPDPRPIGPPVQATVPCNIQCAHPTEPDARFSTTVDALLPSGTSLEDLSNSQAELSHRLCAEQGGVVSGGKNAVCSLRQ